MKQTLLLALLALVAATGCKRININGDIGDRYEILVTRTWKLIELKDNAVRQDIPDCEDDNYFVFEDNGTGRYEEGAVNCYETGVFDPENPDEIPTATDFTWSITGDQRYIYLKNFFYEGDDPEWEVQDMDYHMMKVKYVRMVDGAVHTYEATLAAR